MLIVGENERIRILCFKKCVVDLTYGNSLTKLCMIANHNELHCKPCKPSKQLYIFYSKGEYNHGDTEVNISLIMLIFMHIYVIVPGLL